VRLPQRPSGVRLTTIDRIRSDIGAVMGVSMKPGQIAFTLMLREATSRAKARTPPLAAL
jgi:hypothetical protein